MDNRIRIVLAIVLAIVTGAASWFWMSGFKQRQSSFAVLTLSKDLVANETVITDDMLAVVTYPESARAQMGQSVVPATPAAREGVLNHRATRNVPAGSLLLYEYVKTNPRGELSSRLAAGSRAITIPVAAATTVGFFVEPGSLVDIVGTVLQPQIDNQNDPGADAMRVATKTILQKVRVLAVGGAKTPDEYQQISDVGYSTVTIDVTPQQAELLVFSMQQVQGGLTLLLRNPDDLEEVKTPSVSWKDWVNGDVSK